MSKKITAKIGAVLMTAAIAMGAAAMPASATYNKSTTSQADAFTTSYQTYWKAKEKQKFPHGKYWNSSNPDSYTSTPCRDHSNYSTCGTVPLRYTVSAGYTALPSSESYTDVYQCYAFARKLAIDFYGGCQVWTRHRTDKNFKVRVGDQIRIRYTYSNGTSSYHSVFVTDVTGNSIKFAECNAGSPCQIRWDRSASIHNGGFIDGGNYYSILWVDRPAMAGDVNGDAVVDWSDANALYAICNGTYNYGSANRSYVREAADLNNDGNVTYTDYQLLCRTANSIGYLPTQKFLTGIKF